MALRNLDEAPRNEPLIVAGFDEAQIAGDETRLTLLARMMELGLIEGAEIVKKHAAPFSQDPIAVEVDGLLVALRRTEARLVFVMPVEENRS